MKRPTRAKGNRGLDPRVTTRAKPRTTETVTNCCAQGVYIYNKVISTVSLKCASSMSKSALPVPDRVPWVRGGRHPSASGLPKPCQHPPPIPRQRSVPPLHPVNTHPLSSINKTLPP
jgi:hypothetical protein